MKYNIALVPGDGIGPEIVGAAVEALKITGEKFGHEFECTTYLAGGAALDKYGVPLPQETVEDHAVTGQIGTPPEIGQQSADILCQGGRGYAVLPPCAKDRD